MHNLHPVIDALADDFDFEKEGRLPRIEEHIVSLIARVLIQDHGKVGAGVRVARMMVATQGPQSRVAHGRWMRVLAVVNAERRDPVPLRDPRTQGIESSIYQAAKTMIDAHGAKTAWQHAVARAVELSGDEVGQATWSRVIAAIDEMTRVERRFEEGVQ